MLQNQNTVNTNVVTESIKFHSNENFLPVSAIDHSIKAKEVKTVNIDEYESDIFFKTLHGEGSIVLKNGLMYKGSIKHGLLNSEGTEGSHIIFPNKTNYAGEIKENVITGKGWYIFDTENEYDGDLVNGLRHGVGNYKSKDDSVKYTGEWKKGLKHGKGDLILKNFIYSGDWENGQKHGYGVCTWPEKNNNFYKGEFFYNKIEGNGYMIWGGDTQEKYIGSWKGNLREGLGVQIWYDIKGDNKYVKNRYVGQWYNNMRNGYGVFFYSNGSKYEGYWKDNTKHGLGVATDADGVAYLVSFTDNKISEYIKLYSDEQYLIDKHIKEMEILEQNINIENELISNKQSKNNNNNTANPINNKLNSPVKKDVQRQINKRVSVVSNESQQGQSQEPNNNINTNSNNINNNTNTNNNSLNIQSNNSSKSLNQQISAKEKEKTRKGSLFSGNFTTKNGSKGHLANIPSSIEEANENESHLDSNNITKQYSTISTKQNNKFQKQTSRVSSIANLKQNKNNNNNDNQLNSSISTSKKVSILKNNLNNNNNKNKRDLNAFDIIEETNEGGELASNNNFFSKHNKRESMASNSNNMNQTNRDNDDKKQILINPFKTERLYNNIDKNPFSFILDLTDLIEKNPRIGKEIYEINNALLRLLSEMRSWYRYYSGLANMDPEDFRMRMSSTEQVKAFQSHKTMSVTKGFKREKEKEVINEAPIKTECINDDIGYLLNMYYLWKFIRDSGITGVDFTLADFNRCFYSGKKNYTNYFTIDESNKGENGEKIYKNIYLSIRKSKKIFEEKYSKEIESMSYFYSNMINMNTNTNTNTNNANTINNSNKRGSIEFSNNNSSNKKINNNNYNNNFFKNNINSIDELNSKRSNLNMNNIIESSILPSSVNNSKDRERVDHNKIEVKVSYICYNGLFYDSSFDLHSHETLVLPRQFYESLVRISYLKFSKFHRGSFIPYNIYLNNNSNSNNNVFNNQLSIKNGNLNNSNLNPNLNKISSNRGGKQLSPQKTLSNINNNANINNANTLNNLFSPDKPMQEKIKFILDNYIKTNRKLRAYRKLAGLDSSNLNQTITMTTTPNQEQLLSIFKSLDFEFEMTFSMYQTKLKPLFISLYSLSTTQYKSYDKTITYKFVWEKVIKQIDFFANIDKFFFCQCINYYHKDKPIVIEENKHSPEIYFYLDTLLNLEMIFVEFMELMFLCIKKTIIYRDKENNITTNKGNHNNRPSVSNNNYSNMNSNVNANINNSNVYETNSNSNREALDETQVLNILSQFKPTKDEKRREVKEGYYYPERVYHKQFYDMLEKQRQEKEKELEKAREIKRVEFENKMMDFWGENVIEIKENEMEEEEESEEYDDY